ncbi:MAG: MFS transporter permease [Coleofasciculus sp. B1-GNL1-01]|uniref:MFS transporter permease n=1 Tax=Coleofasciculus sp. B1-GNL1-01 TaxID=3068484 RepID=UPI0032F5DDA7
MISIYLGSRQLNHKYKIPKLLFIDPNKVQYWLNHWTDVNGSLEKMLPSPREENTEAEISPDISAYSFDRVVVCDSATIAQLLIANNFHFENNCAVLSINGYPRRIFRTVLQMLKRNPELKVYALHDASPRGVRLLHHLRTSQNWFAESTVTLYDLGLLPRHILNSKRNFFVRGSAESAQQAKQLSPDVRQNLSAEELEWLELGNFVELESFTPRRLLQIVSQGIARRQLSPDGTDSAFVEIESDSSSGESYLLASESFG